MAEKVVVISFRFIEEGGKMIGKKVYESGAVYTGELVNGWPEGEGTITFVNGGKYVGYWKNGKYDGYGTITFANGGKYVGGWKNGKCDGYGTITFANGAKYVGGWENGKYNGRGTFYYENGDRYDGKWVDNIMEGKGKLTKKAVQNINWDNGRYDTQESFTGIWKGGKKNGCFLHMLYGMPYDEEYKDDKQIDYPLSYEIDTQVSSITGKTIKCWYSNQSGFMIETPSTVLIFDWYRKQLPPIPQGKPLHIFISHTHQDHFNKGIFALGEKFRNIKIYMGYDSSNSNFNQMLRNLPNGISSNIGCFDGRKRLITDFGEVRSLPSTDSGVAFIVKVDGMILYHAGDLAWWNNTSRETYDRWAEEIKIHKPYANVESYESYCKTSSDISEKEFKNCVEPLRGNNNYGKQTVEYYLDLADIAFFTPMHLWGNYNYIGTFAKQHPEFCKKMIAVNTQNVKINHTIQQGYPYYPYILRF